MDYTDLLNLTRDELLEEYCKLFDRFQDLRECNESDTQKIHELKRALDTATAAESYLSQELEQYTNSDNTDTEKELHKTQMDLLDMKKKCGRLEASHSNLLRDNNILVEENLKIAKKLEECQKNNRQLPYENDINISDDYLMRIELLENENTDLLQKIEGFEEQSICYTLAIAEYEKNIEILRDQINCLEESLQSKRLDLKDKIQIIESTQDQLADANAKLAMLSSAPDDIGRKGNSLFAEVDDQRQKMKQLLAAQKKSYMEMKKIYSEREYEVRRLKRENISMRTEFETCSKIFCNADKIYQEKLIEQIRNLHNRNEELERKVKWTQERLNELAANKGVLFLDSMLSFCKKETEELKSQLHRLRLLNGSLEEQLRDAQQEMARWRFESLKSRCILIDRENLLTENKITFKPIHAVEYRISEKDQKEAKPLIVSKRRSSILENLTNRKSTTPSKLSLKNETKSPQQHVNTDSLNDNSIKSEIIGESNEKKSVPFKNEEQILEKILVAAEMSKTISSNQCNEDKENSIICLDDTPILGNFANLRAKLPSPPSPMRPSQNSKITTTPLHSILTKNDTLINSSKHVQFSSDGDTVHNMSLEANSPEGEVNSNKKSENDTETKNSVSSNNTKQKLHNKSNNVVRRVVVSSKHV